MQKRRNTTHVSIQDPPLHAVRHTHHPRIHISFGENHAIRNQGPFQPRTSFKNLYGR